RAHAANVDRMITIGTTPADAAKAIALSKKYPGVYTAAGVHPHYSTEHQDKAKLKDELRELLTYKNAVAIGEMGLDKHYSDPTLDIQRVAFATQLELALELDRSVIIHSREAVDEVIEMI